MGEDQKVKQSPVYQVYKKWEKRVGSKDVSAEPLSSPLSSEIKNLIDEYYGPYHLGPNATEEDISWLIACSINEIEKLEKITEKDRLLSSKEKREELRKFNKHKEILLSWYREKKGPDGNSSSIHESESTPRAIDQYSDLEKKGRAVLEKISIVFRITDGVWFLGLNGDEKPIPDDLDGFHYIRYIIEQYPHGIDSHVLYSLRKPVDLGTENQDAEILSQTSGSTGDRSLSIGAAEEPLPKTDRKAISKLKQTIQEFEEDIEAAKQEGLANKVDELEVRKQQLETHLRKVSGCYAKIRTEKSTSEKSRQKVAKAVARALHIIRDKHPKMAQYLNEKTISTRTECCYKPGLSPTPDWILR